MSITTPLDRPGRLRARPVGPYRSTLEQHIADLLDLHAWMWQYEPVMLRRDGRRYTPDFLARPLPDGRRFAIEVKPTAEIARAETRLDMLLGRSPLWLIADVFVLAFGEGRPWLCTTDPSRSWFACGIDELGDFWAGDENLGDRDGLPVIG